MVTCRSVVFRLILFVGLLSMLCAPGCIFTYFYILATHLFLVNTTDRGTSMLKYTVPMIDTYELSRCNLGGRLLHPVSSGPTSS